MPVAAPMSGVTKAGPVANTNAPEPVSSDNKFANADDVVEFDTVPPEIVRIPVADPKFAPNPPYCVPTTVPFQTPAVIAPLAILTPEILDPVPPTYKDPPIPTPPETCKAPLLIFVDTVACPMATTPVAVLLVKVEDPSILAPVEA